MSGGTSPGYRRPGLFRVWDLQQVLRGGDDYHVASVEMRETRVPLFAVYRRNDADTTRADAEILS